MLFLKRCHPQEHHIIDRDIRDLAVCCDLAGIGQDISLLYMIILVLHEGAYCTVDGVILAGLDLDGDGGQAVVIVDHLLLVRDRIVILVPGIIFDHYIMLSPETQLRPFAIFGVGIIIFLLRRRHSQKAKRNLGRWKPWFLFRF